ncbi:MAG: LysR family transcriptional regulator [Myxococcales bacterium FL481]|nr:MAG: LysR family transcriptional regulator [Myxococcales bacterium FL481]
MDGASLAARGARCRCGGLSEPGARLGLGPRRERAPRSLAAASSVWPAPLHGRPFSTHRPCHQRPPGPAVLTRTDFEALRSACPGPERPDPMVLRIPPPAPASRPSRRCESAWAWSLPLVASAVRRTGATRWPPRYPRRVDWNDVRFFLALARSGSVRAAGAVAGVSHSTVARRIEALEVRLSTRLFDRTRDGYALTDAGRDTLPQAERIEREMAALERVLVGQDDRLAGRVRVTCCDEFVSAMMIGELARLCEQHADLELAITADSRAFDLSKREADLAVRTLGVGATPPEHLIAKKLVPVVIANYAAHAHAERLVNNRDDPASRWLAVDDRRFATQMIAASSYPDRPAWGAFSSLGLLLQATQLGLGLAMLPCYVADATPSLTRLPCPDLRHVADLWLLCHPDLRSNARLRAAREAVAGALFRQASLFRGEYDRDSCREHPDALVRHTVTKADRGNSPDLS